jgi:hypothetical protein
VKSKDIPFSSSSITSKTVERVYNNFGGLEAKPAREHAAIKVKSQIPAKIIDHGLSANSRIHQPMARPMRAAASRA